MSKHDETPHDAALDALLLKTYADQTLPEADENARKIAVNLAVAAFAENKKAKPQTIFQGLRERLRLTGRDNLSDRRTQMNKKYVYGGLATAAVVVLALSGTFLDAMRETSSTNAVTQAAAFKKSKFDIDGGAARQIASAEAPMTNEPVQNYADAVEAQSQQKIEQEIASADMAQPQELAAAPAPSVAAGAPPMPTGAMVAQRAMTTSSDGSFVSPSMPMPIVEPMPVPGYQDEGRDKFKDVEQSVVKDVKTEPVSTFSIDVDTASYSFTRRQISAGVLPQKDAVRIEELVNYFDYAYPKPASRDEPFKANVTLLPSPWHEGRQLMHIGIQGYEVEQVAKPHSNLVFLLDTSGSMQSPDKLPLVQKSMKMLLGTLQPEDTISIVTYAGSAGTVLQPTKASNTSAIMGAIDNLFAGGGTAGAEGLQQAYTLAEQTFVKGGVNRVILATDGDFNIGITEPDELKSFIERKRETGIFLSVLGFGQGNLNDALMQELAQNGNGVAAYIDSVNEAQKVLVEQAGAMLFPIAKDVKIQVDFNPTTVSEYRLIGYETRALNREDFNNDKVDAGDIGSGHRVTAIYEITPVGTTRAIDASRYDDKPPAGTAMTPENDKNAELAFVKIRYKLPEENTSKLITQPVTNANALANAPAGLQQEVNWSVAVATFGELLKGGKYSGKLTYDDVINMAQPNKGADPYNYRGEFIQLVRQAKTAQAM